jgi:2-polyprenyl-3-methyl-5-hydroxy-6-metoxy-1,4-benzoquinol methylase
MMSNPRSSAAAAPVPGVTAVRPEGADVETSSEAYARRFAGAVGAWFLRTQESATLRMLAPYRGATVLDVGGGHGQVTAALVAEGFRVTVFGSSECCRRRIEPFVAAGTCRFQSGSLLGLPYPARSYDVVLSYRLLAHVARWRALLIELARVTRRALLIDVPTRASVNCLIPWLFSLKKRVEGDTRSYRLFDEREVVEVAASAGLVADERYPQFFLPMALHRAVGVPAFSSTSERAFRTLGATGRFGSPVIVKLVRHHC